ncbi:MAG: DTW domain-containing protein [Planctomycetes bacterium]|nr:DTW domain-containing protein [Planctomycetota bacterium]
MSEPTSRERCYRCLRPLPMCHCGDLPTVATQTRIFILQHPHERGHPFGTARLARLCLPNVSVHEPWAGFTGTLALPLEVPARTAVLYPHERAVDLDSLSPADRPEALIVVDGTWAHARRLYRENTWLHRLPHVRLQPAQPSRYRIRREPRPDYVSTLEAIVEALRVLEPTTRGLDDLLAAFDRMIDRQIAHAAEVKRFGRFKAPRQRESRARSPHLRRDDLVVVYAESSLPGGDVHAARELVHWVATRLDGEAVFEAVLQPAATPPAANHLAHMRLSAADLAGGEPLAAARTRFLAFVGPAPALATWTQTTFDWGRQLLPADAAQVVLKTTYCNVAGRRAGLLEEVVRREGLTVPPPIGRGRAGERLANALAVARWLRAVDGR